MALCQRKSINTEAEANSSSNDNNNLHNHVRLDARLRL